MIATDNKGKIQWFPNLAPPAPQPNNLIGATVDIAWVDKDGNSKMGDHTMITLAVDGTYAIYTYVAADFPNEGTYDLQFRATLSDGTGPLYSEMVTISVGRKITLGGW